jgi:hypothetical protein
VSVPQFLPQESFTIDGVVTTVSQVELKNHKYSTLFGGKQVCKP